VKWSPTTITYDNRLQRYERFPLNPIHLDIHWFSIVNSCVTVLLLTGFLATILMRVLKQDFVKFSKEDGACRAGVLWCDFTGFLVYTLGFVMYIWGFVVYPKPLWGLGF
jgi:hypothetical protein